MVLSISGPMEETMLSSEYRKMGRILVKSLSYESSILLSPFLKLSLPLKNILYLAVTLWYVRVRPVFFSVLQDAASKRDRMRLYFMIYFLKPVQVYESQT